MSESGADKILSVIQRDEVANEFKELHWTGSFRDYLDKVIEEPRIARNAYQRVYDMVLSHGTEEYVERKERVTRYRFFTLARSRVGSMSSSWKASCSSLLKPSSSSAPPQPQCSDFLKPPAFCFSRLA